MSNCMHGPTVLAGPSGAFTTLVDQVAARSVQPLWYSAIFAAIFVCA